MATRYVALLRGVNVGGVTMKMADLAEVVRGLGYDDVKTVLASGNVLFTVGDAAEDAPHGAARDAANAADDAGDGAAQDAADRTAHDAAGRAAHGGADRAKARLEAALRERFGYEAWVHVLSVEALREIVAGYPFPRSDDRHAYVVFILKPEVREELLAVELDPAVERAQTGQTSAAGVSNTATNTVANTVIYWTTPKGQTLDSAMGKAQSSSRFKPWLTTRNLNTLEKLL